MSDLAGRAREFAQRQDGPLRKLLHELADVAESVAPTPSASKGAAYVYEFLRSRKVNLMGWQWKRVRGPVTMKQEGEEWVEL